MLANVYRDRIGKGGDELLSATVLEMLDIDGDGRVEFVTFGNASLADVATFARPDVRTRP
jgi:hypothetical protein